MRDICGSLFIFDFTRQMEFCEVDEVREVIELANL